MSPLSILVIPSPSAMDDDDDGVGRTPMIVGSPVGVFVVCELAPPTIEFVEVRVDIFPSGS